MMWIEGLSQRSRRGIAVVSFVGLPLSFVWSDLLSGTSVPKVVWGPVTFALMLVSLAGAFVLYGFVRDRATYAKNLDERQRQLRDRAWVLCYQVLAVLVVVTILVVAVIVLGLGRVVTLDATFVMPATINIGVLVPLLPVAALAWIEPDPPAEA